MLNYMWAVMILVGILYGTFTGNLEAVTSKALDSAGEAVSLCITMAGVMALWMGMMEIGQQSGLMEKMTGWIRPLLHFLFPRIPKDHPALLYISTNIIANVLGLGWACTPAGLKAMEALAKLEEERKTPGYETGQAYEAGYEHEIEQEHENRREYEMGQRHEPGHENGMEREQETGRMYEKRQETEKKEEKKTAMRLQERRASNEMCTFLILNISSLQLIPVNMIAYRSQYGSTNPVGIIAPALVATTVSTLAAILFCKIKERK